MNAILVRTTLATLIAFAGGAFGVLLGQVAARRLNLLVYVATGVLLAVTVCDILPEAKSGLTWPVFVVAAASGYALFWLIGKYVYHICPACALAAFDEETTRKLGQTALLLMIALSLHSLMDGIAVVVGDEMAAGQGNVGVMLAISIHKLPEGMALALLLIGAGYRRWTALWWTLSIEATTELGGLMGLLFLRGASLPMLRLLFAHTGGGFLYLVASAYSAFVAHPSRRSVRLLIATSGLSFVLTSLLLFISKSFE